jgi:hypothetical protein
MELASERNGRVKVGLDDPCPCGSGKIFRKCHGRSQALRSLKASPVNESAFTNRCSAIVGQTGQTVVELIQFFGEEIGEGRGGAMTSLGHTLEEATDLYRREFNLEPGVRTLVLKVKYNWETRKILELQMQPAGQRYKHYLNPATMWGYPAQHFDLAGNRCLDQGEVWIPLKPEDLAETVNMLEEYYDLKGLRIERFGNGQKGVLVPQ